MASLPALTLVLLAAVPIGAANAQSVRVDGPVEIDQVEAVEASEAEVVAAVWKRYGKDWKDDASALVPAGRVEAAVRGWLRRALRRLKVARAEPIDVQETTVGPAFRQSWIVALDGAGAERMRVEGARVVRRVNREYRRSYAGIGCIWLVLLLVVTRLDRATRGYLTKRLRLGGLVVAVALAVLIWP